MTAMKRWTLIGANTKDKEKRASMIRQIMNRYDCGMLLAALLVQRGYDADTAAELLDEELLFDDPFELVDMDLAVERINRAVDEFERIVIYGDYDCDGVTASVLLYTFLSTLGADVEIRLPHRQKDGYGLHEAAVKKMAEDGVQLIITVDNGISAIEEAKLIAELGMDLVVTDHHLPGEQLPQAVAVVDPHRKDCPSRFKDLAGCGVALKLVAALQEGDHVTAFESFASLAAIGTVGDIMPMTDENRSIVRYGIKQLTQNDLPGLTALMDSAGIRPEHISTKDIGFALVPRINAAGRLDDAMAAAELLMSEDYSSARTLAERLTEANAARQKLEHQITEAIQLQFAKDPIKTYQRVLVAVGEDWHSGVIGICASRLVDRYGKPSFVLAVDKETGMAHGSARGFSTFLIYDALHATAEYLSSYGGHEGAGGFSLKAEDIPAWEQALYAYCEREFDRMPDYELQADMLVNADTLRPDAVKELSRLEPYGSKPTGEKNKAPVFALKNCELLQTIPLSGGKHLRLKVKNGTQTVDILMFGTPSDSFYYPVGSKLDFLVSASVSQYQGNDQLSLRAIDYRSSGISQDKFFSAKAYYEKLRRKEKISDYAILMRMGPTREEIGIVYKALMQREVWERDAEDLYPILVDPNSMNYCKYRLCIDILSELAFVRIDKRTGWLYCAPSKQKVNLNESKLYAYFYKLTQKTAD